MELKVRLVILDSIILLITISKRVKHKVNNNSLNAAPINSQIVS
jgi:hypothetical protein